MIVIKKDEGVLAVDFDKFIIIIMISITMK